MAPNDTAYTAGWQTLCKLCQPLPPQKWGLDYRFLGASQPCGPTGWLEILLIKVVDVETNPGQTTTRKQVWICDICHRQIEVRKKISITGNRTEHWVHLRCAGIRLAQYSNTWTCHQHRESRHNTTPPYHTLAQAAPPTPPTPPQPKHRPHIPPELVKPKPNPVTHSPPTPPTLPRPKHTLHLHLSTQSSLAGHLH